jgi:uncharacterized membrane protein
MAILIAGLVLFLGVHSTRIFAEGWRAAMIRRLGPGRWKAAYSLVSLLGLVLIIWGFGLVRQQPVQWWPAPFFMRHAAWLLTAVAFILLAAAYVPRNAIKARLHHPMAMGVVFWATAHLLANGNRGHVVLFGSFLAWAVASFLAARRRDRMARTLYPAGSASGTAITVLAGLAVWAAFAFWAHGLLIGIRPM